MEGAFHYTVEKNLFTTSNYLNCADGEFAQIQELHIISNILPRCSYQKKTFGEN